MHFRHRLIHLHTRSTQDTSLRHRKQFHWSEEDYHQSARESRPGKYSNSIGSFMSQEMSEWEMIPPRSPQFGELWEAVVKSMKHHLRRIVGVQILSLEELNILVIQIEGFQISQPLSAMSSDPNHLQLITPAQFFLGKSARELPTARHSDDKLHLGQRFKLLEESKRSFRKAWYRDYLVTLQIRERWIQSGHSFQLGDLVLVAENCGTQNIIQSYHTSEN